MQKWKLRLYPECVFSECTNPDHVDFPNTAILTDSLIFPMDYTKSPWSGTGIHPFGGRFHCRDCGFWDNDNSGNM